VPAGAAGRVVRARTGHWIEPRGRPVPAKAGRARTFGNNPLAPMENAIKFLRIQNFKSIKDVTLHPRRVNLIIGEPNVGKSNLLEAMTLLGSITYEPTERFLGSFIRYEEPRQLFYDNLVGNTIKVETDRDVVMVFFDKKTKHFTCLYCDVAYHLNLTGFSAEGSNELDLTAIASLALSNLPALWDLLHWEGLTKDTRVLRDAFDAQGYLLAEEASQAIVSRYQGTADRKAKRYTFLKRSALDEETGSSSLLPPHGSNLIEVIQTHAPLRQEIGRMFERYGQKLNLRVDERKLEIIKDQEGMTYSYPYSSVADTLQRIIFYLATIESNEDAVLLFEEPEAHSFPVYVARLGRRIVESRSNQFFVDTHSPYLITEVLERMLPDEALAGELAIFAAYYENHQTKLHQLSDEEIRSIREDGIDVFYNMKRFTTGAADA
jgi:AAA15 family ATPase/GTPase